MKGLIRLQGVTLGKLCFCCSGAVRAPGYIAVGCAPALSGCAPEVRTQQGPKGYKESRPTLTRPYVRGHVAYLEGHVPPS
jgi:hypothetical protein